MKRIGIYGGSFNPIHAGHLGLALKAVADHQLEKVLVVPAKVSPFKTDTPQDDVTFTDAQRWHLVTLACADQPLLEPWDVELRRGGVSYAIDTVREVRAANPGAEIYFIIGEDSVEGLPRWKDWPMLKTLAHFVSYPRTRESSTEIRRRLSAGESVADLLPSAVAQAIGQMFPRERARQH